MLKRGISLLLTLAMILSLLVMPAAAESRGAGTVGTIDRFQVLTKLAAYDQVFTTMGADSKDSMPIGNGNMAANVWVESDGDLVCYLSRCDSYSEAGRLLKVGRIRISAAYEDGSNVFAAGTAFRQKLVLAEGAVYITAGSGANEVTFKLWIDGENDVMEVEADAQTPIKLTVKNDLWRTEELTMDKSGGNNRSFIGVHINYGNDIPTESADVVENRTKDDQLLWYHRNEYSRYETMVEYQKLNAEGKIEDYFNKYPDPYLHNTFGALVEGTDFTASDTKTLTTENAGTSFNLRVYTHCDQTDTAMDWEEAIKAKKTAANDDTLAARWQAHKAWWEDVWTRSWIFITGDTTAQNVTRGYILQRYQVACMGASQDPIHFNGGLFTMCTNAAQGDDYRDWGSMYWHQNTRLVYWPMLAAGDYEFLKAYFDLYLNALPLRKEISEKFFGKEGAYYPEQMYEYGADGTRDKLQWAIDGTGDYTTYHWQNGFEVIMMMLDAYDMTGDETYVTKYIIPIGQELVRFYYNMYYNAETGKLKIYPSNSLEMYWNCTNPTDHIAGLTAILPRMLALTNSAATPELKAEWQKIYNALPEIPVSSDGSKYLPAESYGGTHNSENPELYTVFPYEIASVGSDDETLQRGIATFNARKFDRDGCWYQDGVQAATLGLASAAKSNVSVGLTNKDSGSQFAGFWAKGNDEVPDFDNGGQASVALQRMLLQSHGEQIYVLPAWPSEWNVDFCLDANYQTSVHLTYENGQITGLTVESDDSGRAEDIVLPARTVEKTLEFEDLRYTLSSHQLSKEPASQTDGTASGGAILTYKPAEEGANITFAFSVEEAAEYDLSVRLKRYSTYGTYQFSVNGQPVGGAIDGSSGSNYGSYSLGKAALKAGENTITLTVTGKGSAGSGYDAALDSLSLSAKISTETGSGKEITSFVIDGHAAAISGNAISLELPYGTDLTNLAPTITTSAGATVSPASGEAKDFTNPVVYTVTSADGQTKTFTVTVTVAKPETTVEWVDNTDSRIQYTGTWKDPYAAEGYYGGDQVSSNDSNASATLAFTGTGIGYVTEISTSCGLVGVYIDGKLAEEVDTYTSAAIGTKQLELFKVTDLPYGNHTITIRLAGKSGSSNPHVKLDAFKIYVDPTQTEPEVPEIHSMDDMLKETYTDSTGSLDYRLYVPANYDHSKAYPLLVYLNGAGSRGSDNAKQLSNLAPLMNVLIDNPDYPCIVAVPQLPSDQQWVDTPWTNGSYDLDAVAESDSMKLLMGMLEDLAGTYHVDDNRLYLMGQSMGGYGTWDAILRYPDKFAAAIPMCGAGDPGAAAKIADLPLMVLHGSADPTVPVSGSREMVSALETAGSPVLYYEYEGDDHYVQRRLFEQPALWLNWLFSQKKGTAAQPQPNPEALYWPSKTENLNTNEKVAAWTVTGGTASCSGEQMKLEASTTGSSVFALAPWGELPDHGVLSGYITTPTSNTSGGAVDGGGGLVFRYQDASNYLHVRLTKDGVNLLEMVNGKAITNENVAYDWTPGRIVQLTAVLQGSQITVYADQVKVFTYTIKTPALQSGGQAGVRYYSYNVKGYILVDDVIWSERTDYTDLTISNLADRQVIQRNAETESAQVTFSGTWSGKKPETISLTVAPYEGGQAVIAPIQATVNADGTWTAQATVPQGGWYQLTAQADNGCTVQSGRWGVGINVLLIGQSNMQGTGQPHFDYENADDRASNFLNETWAYLKDPYANGDTSIASNGNNNGGSMAPALANALIERYNVPVGIIPAAKSGAGLYYDAKWKYWTGDEEHPGRNADDPDDRSTLYGNSIYRAWKAGGCEYIVMNGGEHDITFKRTEEQFLSDLRTLIGWYQEDLPGVPFIFCQLGACTASSWNTEAHEDSVTAIREAMWKANDPANGVYVAAVELGLQQNSDNLHYTTDSQKIIGRRVAHVIGYILGDESYYLPPTIASAAFADESGSVIDIQVTHSGGNDLVGEGSFTGFEVFDNAGVLEVQSVVKLDSDTLRLTLDTAASGETTLRYCYGLLLDVSNLVKDNSSLGLPLNSTPGSFSVEPYTPTEPTVTEVTVTPSVPQVQRGSTQQFAATVTGENNPSQAVTWSVSGNQSNDTTIDQTGLLDVAADETAATLTVTAVSQVDDSKQGTATVVVTDVPHVHELTCVERKEPTCTRPGNELYWRCECGAYFRDAAGTEPVSEGDVILPALGHDYETTTVPPTATEQGYDLHTCKRCGDSYRDNFTDPEDPVIPVPGHAIGVVTVGNGTVTVDPKRAEAGETVTITAAPDEGYEVDNITVTSVTGETIAVIGNRFTMPNCSVKVEVSFRKTMVFNPFVDVKAGDWFFEEVLWAYENDVMDGVGGGKFAPDGSVTRAMVWTVLARMDGQVISGSDWMEQARAWAMAEGVSDGTMATGNVTREQLATMLYRYLGSPAVSGSLTGYPDTSKVSDWAENAMVWATENGIINGMDGKLNPQGGATRAQLAAMLMRFDSLNK